MMQVWFYSTVTEGEFMITKLGFIIGAGLLSWSLTAKEKAVDPKVVRAVTLKEITLTSEVGTNDTPVWSVKPDSKEIMLKSCGLRMRYDVNPNHEREITIPSGSNIEFTTILDKKVICDFENTGRNMTHTRLHGTVRTLGANIVAPNYIFMTLSCMVDGGINLFSLCSSSRRSDPIPSLKELMAVTQRPEAEAKNSFAGWFRIIQ